jgi:hypothetical protein
MTTVSRGLPDQPHLDVPKREARELLDLWRVANRDAFDRIRRRHPRFSDADDVRTAAGPFRLSDAQFVIAREYGFAHWAELKQRCAADAVARELIVAIRADDRASAVRLVQEHPDVLHVPLWSGNWGPPMSHAANIGRLEIIRAMAALGARDYQHAFDRAVLQGQIECARWLLANGARMQPGIVMGACETLDAGGIRFAAEINAPFTDERGDSLSPLAMVLETYARRPDGKHAILEILAQRGYLLPDTPMMAFHRGDLAKLEEHLRRDPGLLAQRFAIEEIYPKECGCGRNGPGLHWTPIDGATLLHLAVDFHEHEIFDWLLARGADVNARAGIDRAGFGGHTPLFNAVVCGVPHRAAMTRALLEHGAAKDARASLRKFLDWTENPRWHEARETTAVEWARGFPDRSWVNTEALLLLE